MAEWDSLATRARNSTSVIGEARHSNVVDRRGWQSPTTTAMNSVPNKPVLPTAASRPRQTGQPLGLPEKRRGNELRRAKRGPRSAGNEL